MCAHPIIDPLSSIITATRMLSIDQVEAAKSGHPGLPLGAAPLAVLLWHEILCHDPSEPNWINRDRFILSAGHGSALLYSLLHLYGYGLTIEDLKNFRQWQSRTPGHPEYGHTPGVEATTGPLGQGFAMGVGMAMAERRLAHEFNRPAFPLIDHLTVALVSDGDLMEGIASEAASLAGAMKLGKLIYLYDQNSITIEGSVELAFTEEVARRFEGYQWHVDHVADGNDVAALRTAVRRAIAEKERPSLICVRTVIGQGSPKQGTEKVHGEPLGADSYAATRAFYHWSHPPFTVPTEVSGEIAVRKTAWSKKVSDWKGLFEKYRREFPELAGELERRLKRELPSDWDRELKPFAREKGPMATRDASGELLQTMASRLPELIGGSADLAPSTKTYLKSLGSLKDATSPGRNIHFGVREAAMGAALNGIALHNGFIPFGATFLVFSDYARPTVRLAALMKTHAIFVFTHDSIALGEDGPTHQPIEHLASLRAIPNLLTFRPADANETLAAWKLAVSLKRPSALVLTRQKVPILDADRFPISAGVARGAYIVEEPVEPVNFILLATGSELHLALEAAPRLREEGVFARVVSMPCWELFSEQPESYRSLVLPKRLPARLAIEAASSMGWHRWIGDSGAALTIDRFGASAPERKVLAEFGFTVETVVEKALAVARAER